MRSGLNLQGYQISGNVKKRMLVDSWAIRMGSGHASYPEIPEFIEEHENYEATKSPGGIIQYSAPPGLHDDWVMSAALANQLLPPHDVPAQDPTEVGDGVFVQDAAWDKM